MSGGNSGRRRQAAKREYCGGKACNDGAGEGHSNPKSLKHVADQDWLIHPDPELVSIVGNLTSDFNPKMVGADAGTKSTNSRDEATYKKVAAEIRYYLQSH